MSGWPGRGRRKYGNEKARIDGHLFHSLKEAQRYNLLKLLQGEGKIRDLELQPSFKLEVNGVLVCKYIADFRYVVCETGAVIVEDAKGMKTTDYRIKKKLLKAVHGIEVIET